MTVQIVIPTISPQRDVLCRQTVRQLHAAGFPSPIIARTPPDVTPGAHAQGLTARRGIIRALTHQPDAILHLEDDILLSSRFRPHLLAGLALHGGVIALYLAGEQRFHADYGSLVHRETWVVPVHEQTHWYGCQAVLLPRAVAAHIASIPEHEINAIDFEVRDYLDRRGEQLWAVTPNVVQHLAPVSIGIQASGRHTSSTFL